MYHFSTLSEYLLMAWTAFRAHKLRSTLTTLGIFIGVTTIITIFITIQGLNEYVIGELSNIGSSKIFIQKYPWVIKGDFWKYRNRKNITYKEYEALLKYSKVADYICPRVFSQRTIKYKNETLENILIIGTTDQYKDTDNISPEKGRFFTELDVHRNHRVCIIGYEVAKNFFENENAIGKRVKIGDAKYRVVGTLEKLGTIFGQNIDNWVFVPIGSFKRAISGHIDLQIALSVLDYTKIEDMKDETRGILRKVRKIAPGEEDDFAINQQDQLTDLYKQLTSTLFAIVFIIGGISLVVGGIGIMNIMLVSVTERTKEIGLRKAIGARRINILFQFLIESIFITSIGGILGIIFGYLAGLGVLSKMNLSTSISILSIIIGFGFSSMVGIIAGFYPAWKGAKLNPIDSLRYE